MSDSVIKIEAVEALKFMEIVNLSEEIDGSSESTDVEAVADPDPDLEPSSKQIPKHIIFCDILTRVRVKSLIRFTSVSKDWKFSIRGDYNFIKRHFSHSLTQPDWASLLVLVKGLKPSQVHFLSITNPDGGASVRYLLSLSTDSDYMITDNINGLSCFHPRNGSISDAYNNVYVSCPSLLEISHLPANPTMLQASYSFGVEPLTHKFKVLSYHTNHFIRRNHEAEVNKFYIIGNDDGLWRQISPVLPCNIDHITDSMLFRCWSEGICVDGFIHWILFSKWSILTFSLRDEKFGLMPLPKDLVPQEGVCGGCLRLILVGGCLTIEPQRTITTNLKILWILKDYKNQLWVKKFIIIPFLMDVRYWRLHLLSSVHIDSLFLAQVPINSSVIQHVMYCDLEAKSLRWFHLPGLPPGNEVRVIRTYAESLFSLRDG